VEITGIISFPAPIRQPEYILVQQVVVEHIPVIIDIGIDASSVSFLRDIFTKRLGMGVAFSPS
jgi:hypothetical protein